MRTVAAFPVLLLLATLPDLALGEEPGATLRAEAARAASGIAVSLEAERLPGTVEGGIVVAYLSYRGRRIRDTDRLMRVREGRLAGTLGPFPPAGDGFLPAATYGVVVAVHGVCAAQRGEVLCTASFRLGEAADEAREDRESVARLAKRVATARRVHGEVRGRIAEIEAALRAQQEEGIPFDNRRFQAGWTRDAQGWFAQVYAIENENNLELSGCRIQRLTRSNYLCAEVSPLFRWVIRDLAAPHRLPVPDPARKNLDLRYAEMTPEEREACLLDHLARAGRVLEEGIPDPQVLRSLLAEAGRLADLLDDLRAFLADPSPRAPGTHAPEEEPTPAPGDAVWWSRWEEDLAALRARLEVFERSEEFLADFASVRVRLAPLRKGLADWANLLRSRAAPLPETAAPAPSSWEEVDALGDAFRALLAETLGLL
ncbi:MAG: hypothetical protein HY608_06515 [Planctomycetes bacterium]|nr:hypothetical protein [Planctomycetota bacterium]